MRVEIYLFFLALLGLLAVQESSARPPKNTLKKTISSTKTKIVSSTHSTAAKPKPKIATTCTTPSTLAGDHYSPVHVAKVAQNAGFGGYDWIIAVAVALAGSGGWTEAVLVDTDCSRDRGLWQINSYLHSEVTDAMAFDPNQNAAAAYRISANGSDWSQWMTYTGREYDTKMGVAQAAVSTVSSEG